VIIVSDIKKSLILDTSKEIANHINKKYSLNDEMLYTDIAEFINLNLGFLFDVIEEQINKEEE
jgi:hypothetical protein